MSKYYDPNFPPDPTEWLLLDEGSRIAQAEKYHHKHGIRLPNIKAHATFHAIVENQIAQGEHSVVNAMARLSSQGLRRHDCLHALGWVLAQHLHEQMTAQQPDSEAAANARYFAAVERLQASEWLALEKQ